MELELLNGLPNQRGIVFKQAPNAELHDMMLYGALNGTEGYELGFLKQFTNWVGEKVHDVGTVVGSVAGNVVGVVAGKDTNCLIQNAFSGASPCKKEADAAAQQAQAQAKLEEAQRQEQAKITAYNNFPVNFVKVISAYIGVVPSVQQEENWKKYAVENKPSEFVARTAQDFVSQNNTSPLVHFGIPELRNEYTQFFVDFTLKALQELNLGVFLTEDQILSIPDGNINPDWLGNADRTILVNLLSTLKQTKERIVQKRMLVAQQAQAIAKSSSALEPEEPINTQDDKTKKYLLYGGIGLGVVTAIGVTMYVVNKNKK